MMEQLDLSLVIIEVVLCIGLIVAKIAVEKPNKYLLYMVLSALILLIEIVTTDYGELLDNLIIIQYYNPALYMAVAMFILFMYLIFITIMVHGYRMYKKSK